MGIDYNVYIGPYIKCVNSRADITEQWPGCPRCKYDFSGKFCTRCGTEKGTFEKTTNRAVVDEEDVMNAFSAAGMEFYDELCHLDIDAEEDDEEAEDADHYTSNQQDGPGVSFDPKSDYGIIADHVDAAADKTAMEEHCGKHLAILRQVYGEDKVTVEWGVISYTS